MLCVVLMLIVVYRVVTSSAFFKGVVLPRISKSLNGTLTVMDASVHPFSGVILRQVKVQSMGVEPLFQADEVSIVYHLGDILTGNYRVKKITMIAPTLEIITNPDGSSNLDSLFKKNQPKSGQPDQPGLASQPSKPPLIDINKIVLSNATVRWIDNYRSGGHDLTVLTNINITLANLRNGQTGTLNLAANITLDNHSPASGGNAPLQVTAAGNFTFDLASDLKPTVVQGSLKLAAESLDIARYYDPRTEKSKTAKKAHGAKPTTAEAKAPTSVSSSEPEPINLPLRNFQIDASINRLYLHEVEITNFQTTVNINGSHVVVKSCQLNLNGAPVNATADLELGVPGYRYEIALAATNVPVAPIANSFSSKSKGESKGDVTASAQIKGAGVTGASLQKNLSGQFAVMLTNADIKLVGDKTRRIITPIAVALRLSELSRSDINSMSVNAKIGNGTLNLTEFKAVGSAFSARSQGTITLAEALNKSTINNLPVNLSLPIALAKKAELAPLNMNSNTAYVDLGKVATVGGTIGDPKTKTDYVAIGLLTTKAVVGIPFVAGKEGGKILRGVEKLGGILGGKNETNSNAPATTSTNPPSGNPIDFLNKVPPK